MESRRDMLRALLMGGAVATTVPLFSMPSTKPEGASEPAKETPHVGELLHPLQPGDELGNGWSLHAVAPSRKGAIIMTLSHHDGRVYQTRICRRSAKARGMVQTANFDFVVKNRGNGERITDEDFGCVLLGVAGLVRRNEAAFVERMEIATHDVYLEREATV